MTPLEIDVPPVVKSFREVEQYIQNLLGGVILVGFVEVHDPEIRTCHACKGSGIYRSVNKLVEVCTCLKAIGITRQ
jgi:hypothetical protein